MSLEIPILSWSEFLEVQLIDASHGVLAHGKEVPRNVCNVYHVYNVYGACSVCNAHDMEVPGPSPERPYTPLLLAVTAVTAEIASHL